MKNKDTPSLKAKYPKEKCQQIRKLFSKDVQDWAPIQHEMDLDIQCVTTENDDPTKVAGPWPPAEWAARHSAPQRPCLHEDVTTQYPNRVVNEIEQNPMGIEVAPAGSGADEKTAEFVEGKIRQWEYENQGSLAYTGAARDAAFASFGMWKNEVYYRKGFARKLCIEPIADPRSCVPGFWKKPDASDLRRVWEIERMTHEEFKERWPKAKLKSFSDDMINEAGDWMDENTVQVAAWWHFDTDERELRYVDMGAGTDEGLEIYADEMAADDDRPVLNRRTERTKRVIKTIFNGVEALEETEYPDPGDPEDGVDPEIPFYIVTGRVKYEKGQKVIESVVRKMRTGQLLYDYLISTIQMVVAITGKPVRSGPEGTFDTSTNWDPRDTTAIKEWKPVVLPDGQIAPAPIFELYEPPIQALELLRQSILIGMQNAAGMSSQERQDRTAKSGKALEALRRDMSIGSSHYFASQGIAQERQYRAAARILPVLEKDQPQEQTAVRDKLGKHKMVPANWTGRHAITIGRGKLYQNLQEKQEEFASELLKIGDPQILLAVLPGLCKMKGVGPYGDEIAKMIEAIQPPAMQQARAEGEDAMPPKALQVMNQAQQAVAALNAHIHQLEQKIIELEDEKRARVFELRAKAEEGDKDRANKIQIAEIQASTKENINDLQLQVDAMKHISDTLTERFGLVATAGENEAGRQHDAQQADMSRAHEAEQGDIGRQHEADMELQRQMAAAASQDSAQQHATETQETDLAAQPAATE